MPLTYCSCACAGTRVVLQLDLTRPGKYVCSGCGAPEEAVWMTMDLMQEEYTKEGKGYGRIPEQLLQQATLIEENGQLKALPFKEPWVEGQHDSGRSLKELTEKHKEIADG